MKMNDKHKSPKDLYYFVYERHYMFLRKLYICPINSSFYPEFEFSPFHLPKKQKADKTPGDQHKTNV